MSERGGAVIRRVLQGAARRAEPLLARQAVRLRREVNRLEPPPPAPPPVDLEPLFARLDALEARLEQTRELQARTYEALFGWREQLARLREQPGYDAAWEDPEPLVSVRIATYNNARLLCERTLASLRRQSYERWEAIVVGDAVEDDTEDRIRALGDGRIRFVNLPVRGPYPDDELARKLVAGIPPMNRGLEESRGAWIAPLDHDDEFEDDHIEVLLDHARETRAELVYGKLRVREAGTGRIVPNVVGTWPPRHGHFGLQGALYHGALRAFHLDLNARLIDEPGDWNLTRRMWDAGVRFSFLDRIVTTYYWAPVDEQGKAWLREVMGDS